MGGRALWAVEGNKTSAKALRCERPWPVKLQQEGKAKPRSQAGCAEALELYSAGHAGEQVGWQAWLLLSRGMISDLVLESGV